MKQFTTILLALFLAVAGWAQTAQDSLSLATASWQESDLGQGVRSRCAQIELFGSVQSLSVVSFPARKFSTHLITLSPDAQPTSQIGRNNGAVAAVNGSYFNVRTLDPVTYVLIDRTVYGRTTPEELFRTNGVVAFRGRKGRKMSIFRCDTTDYPRVTQRFRSALAAGPVLVEQGQEVHYDATESFYTHRHPRTLIGKRPNGEVVWVVIDGRFKGEADGATIAECAYIARQLGLTEALNLDGGGSSTLWTDRQGVLNHPYDNHQFDHAGERSVPNALIIKRK